MDSLVRALVRINRDQHGRTLSAEATGYVVGLTGKWGLGKSSIVNLLALKLGSMDRVIVAQFNPWLLGTGDELLTGYFNALRTAMGRNASEQFRALRDDLDRYWGTLVASGKVASAAVDGGASAGALSRLIPKSFKSKPTTPEQERASLEDKIKRLGCAVVVLIDELDRVEDDDVRAVARLIKAVGEIKGLSYLVAYDPKRVAEALGGGRTPRCREAGNSYIEKIIQHPIPLRPLFPEDTKALLEAALSLHGSPLPDTPSAEELDILEDLLGAIETPREVKRLVGAFSVLEEAVRGEISPYDVLGYCWLLTKFPSVRDQIADSVDGLVDDPSAAEMARRISTSASADDELSRIFGPTPKPYKNLLTRLFPRFSEAPNAGLGNRLSRRRNLLRMLYLGNPPGMIPRRDVEALWLLWAADLMVRITDTAKEGRLPDLLDRVDDLWPELPETGDIEFWSNLATLFVRDEDWIKGPDGAQELSLETAKSLRRQAKRDGALTPRVRRTFEALVTRGDLVLAPAILREEIRASGLSRHSRGEDAFRLYEKAQVQELMKREFPRFREAITSGLALRRLPNLELVYALLNASAWDEELRQSLTQQLVDKERVGTFAALITPPGYTTSIEALHELCDAEKLNVVVTELIEDETVFPDPWVRESVLRLHRILNQRDPNFDEGD